MYHKIISRRVIRNRTVHEKRVSPKNHVTITLQLHLIPIPAVGTVRFLFQYRVLNYGKYLYDFNSAM